MNKQSTINQTLENRGKLIASFEGICILNEGTKVQFNEYYWDRNILRITSLKNLDTQVIF